MIGRNVGKVKSDKDGEIMRGIVFEVVGMKSLLSSMAKRLLQQGNL